MKAKAQTAPTEVEAPRPARFISEGVRVDIVQHGSAIDPLTGDVLTAADLPAST